MFKKHLQFSILFAIIFIVELISIMDQHMVRLVLSDFTYLIKPSIVLSLAFYLFIRTKLKGRFNKRIFGGLLFGLLGDCFLMLVELHPNFFMYGLASFLIGHLLYIMAFYLDYKWNPSIEKLYTILAFVIFGACCAGFYLYLRPHLKEMRIPVMAYAFVISLMAIMAVARKGRVSSKSFILIFLGAIFFLVSDALLAYNKFVLSFKYSALAIMSTYMLAQFLITIGTIERKLRKHPVPQAETVNP